MTTAEISLEAGFSEDQAKYLREQMDSLGEMFSAARSLRSNDPVTNVVLENALNRLELRLTKQIYGVAVGSITLGVGLIGIMMAFFLN